jgi:hypothetical protein
LFNAAVWAESWAKRMWSHTVAEGSARTGERSVPCTVAPAVEASTPASEQMVAARSTWDPRAEVTVPGEVTPGTFTYSGTRMISS